MLNILFLLLCFSTAFAEVIDAPVNPIDFQQNPSSIDWRKIDTEHFELIFPAQVTEDAQRVAHLLEKVYPFVSRTQEVLPPKISLVLQNQSTMSNGFVTLAPRRSEWYMTPAVDPELSNTEWLKTLAVHEFRHVVQFERGRTGFTKAFEFLLGQVGHALGLGLSAPPWWYEGDAVGTETALTKGGRGRLPLFERDLRTLLLSGKKFSYDKAHMGSFEDWVPNHYVYGYFYTSYIKNIQGPYSVGRLMYHSAQNSWNPLTFYNTMDATYRKDFEDFYQDVITDLVSHWKEKLDQLKPTPYEVQSPKKIHGWTNYYYPQTTSDGKIVALRGGLSFISQFVLIDGKKEEVLFTPAPLINEYFFRVRKNRMAYLESELDPRWGYREFQRLRVFDIRKKKHILDKSHTKYRLAVLDHSAEYVAAVEWDANQNQSIVILDKKGKVRVRRPYYKKRVITSLDWLDDNELVLVVKDRDDEKMIRSFRVDTGNDLRLYGPVDANLGSVTVSGGHVLVESPESGIDNIFLLEGSHLRQLTSALFGAYSPVISNGKLIYSDYTVNGMQIVSKNLPWEEEQKSSDSFVPVYEKFAVAEGREKLDLTQGADFKVDRYSQLKNAVNLHSWIILAPPLSPTITVSAFSRDVLNKLSLSAGADYNINERTTTGFVSAAWSHLYPVFDLRAAYGGRRQDVKIGGKKYENKWEEGTAEAGVQIPWVKYMGRFTQAFTLRAFGRVIKVTNKLTKDASIVSDGALFSPGAEFQYNLLSRMARRDLLPRLGVSVSGVSQEGKDITGNGMKGSLQSVDGRFYLPGLFLHHSFNHQLAYERQRNNAYEYASMIFYPRGTRSVFLQEFTKYSGNYALPLAYPDWNLSRYLYFKRLSMNLFYDRLDGRYGSFNYRASSLGWELLLDTNFFRIALPLSWGIRGSYVQEGLKRDQNYEIFLNSLLGVF